MHELSIAQSLLAAVDEELRKHPGSRLVDIKVKHGRLSSVVPEALEMAVTALTMGTSIEGVRLTMEQTPLRLRCGGCKIEFEPEDGPTQTFSPCPACGEELGHEVLSGRELFIEYLELTDEEA